MQFQTLLTQKSFKEKSIFNKLLGSNDSKLKKFPMYCRARVKNVANELFSVRRLLERRALTTFSPLGECVPALTKHSPSSVRRYSFHKLTNSSSLAGGCSCKSVNAVAPRGFSAKSRKTPVRS